MITRWKTIKIYPKLRKKKSNFSCEFFFRDGGDFQLFGANFTMNKTFVSWKFEVLGIMVQWDSYLFQNKNFEFCFSNRVHFWTNNDDPCGKSYAIKKNIAVFQCPENKEENRHHRWKNAFSKITNFRGPKIR